MRVELAIVWIPNLHRRVQVHDTAVVAQPQDLAAVDVPRQVDQNVARAKILGDHASHVLGRDLLSDESHTLRRPLFQQAGLVLEVHHGNVRERHVQMFH